MAKTKTRSITGNGSGTQNTTGVVLNPKKEDFKVSIRLNTNGSTTGATVQYTLDYPWRDEANDAPYATSWDANADWIDHSELSGELADAVGNIAFPVWGVRLQVDANGTDTWTMHVLQSGSQG